MFNFKVSKLKNVIYVYPEKSFSVIKTIRDNGTFGLFVYSPERKTYIDIPNINLLKCDESFITRNLQICDFSPSSSS
jgi:hypothetical protein